MKILNIKDLNHFSVGSYIFSWETGQLERLMGNFIARAKGVYGTFKIGKKKIWFPSSFHSFFFFLYIGRWIFVWCLKLDAFDLQISLTQYFGYVFCINIIFEAFFKREERVFFFFLPKNYFSFHSFFALKKKKEKKGKRKWWLLPSTFLFGT